MWVLFGIAAMITAALNVIFTILRLEAKWFRFLSLSLTALTMCAEYEMVRGWVLREDWSALMDVIPTVGQMLWTLVIASILINSISLFVKPKKFD
jgi:hypothetical protein